MIWLAYYTKTDELGDIVVKQVGAFLGGNCKEVIQKVCQIHSIHFPKHYSSECSTDIYVDGIHHHIAVGPVDQLIDLD